MPEELDESHQTLFKTLIDLSPDLVHQPDNQGFKPFHIAVANLHTHTWITDYLISRGSDPKEPDPIGNTAIHYLAPQLLGEKTKALAVAERFKYFLSRGLSIDHRNNLEDTPLFRFISTSWEGTRDYTGTYSHPTYAIEHDISHLRALPVFLDAGADLQTRNGKGKTLLHVTAKQWRKKKWVERDQRDMLGVFKELVARGLDPRAENAKCRTAIDVAVAGGNLFLVGLFGEKGESRVVGDLGSESGEVSEEEGEWEMIEDEGD